MKRGEFRLSGRKSFLTVRCLRWSHPAGEALEASSLGMQRLSWRKAASPGKALSKARWKSTERLALITGGLAQRPTPRPGSRELPASDWVVAGPCHEHPHPRGAGKQMGDHDGEMDGEVKTPFSFKATLSVGKELLRSGQGTAESGLRLLLVWAPGKASCQKKRAI